MSGRVAAIVLAGGVGSRFGAQISKVYVSLGGQPMLSHSLAAMDRSRAVDDIVVVIRKGDRPAFDDVVASTGTSKIRAVVPGDVTRQGSEWAGIQAVRDRCAGVDLVLLHDAARPLVTTDLIDRVVAQVRSDGGGAIPVRPLDQDLIDDRGCRVDTANLVAVQTPQVFTLQALLQVYAQAVADGFAGVDTSQTMQAYTDIAVVVVPGSPDNVKITHPGDLELAERLLAGPDHPLG